MNSLPTTGRYQNEKYTTYQIEDPTESLAAE